MMMIQTNKAVVPGQVCLTRARIVPNPNQPAGRGCHRNLVHVAGKGKCKGKLLVAALTPTPTPIQSVQRRRRSCPLLATSHPNAEIIAINNIPFSTSSSSSSSSSYGDPCLDLLFNSLILYDRDPNPCLIYLKQMLPLAWSHNPLTTLKLIFSVESICFSYQKFDTAVLWLLQNHPKTLLRNLHSIADLPDCGSLYALVQILYVLLVQDGKDVHLHPERYNRDPYYKLLHDGVIDILVERLNSDIDKMKQHKLELEPSDYSPYYLTSQIDKYHRPRKISAAECCVSKTPWHDHRARTIFLRESIAGRLFPPESDQLEEWERLRKDFLVPLTNYYDRKDKVPYEKRYHRQGRDPCEVKKYLEEVKAAAAAGGSIGIIKPDALLPNEIIDFVFDEDVGVGAELQWKAMVDMYRTQKQGKGFGKFKNWLVAGSTNFALEVGLKILMSELSEEPWKKFRETKRQTIVRQLREDVAELIKHGHEDKAFNRVGQIIKDECIVAVYELLDNFCEFILIHLPYIRRHKDCPNDINEAVSSLIYASARCGDLPELRVIRKLFGERYGQKFAVTALELFPGNLVNHQLIEKLSPKSVTDDMKQRLVNEIARNYCIKPEVLAIEYYSEWQQKVKEIRDLEYLIQMFRHIMKELKDLNCKL